MSWLWRRFLFSADRYRREIIELPSFGRFWSATIERGTEYLNALPRERVLAMSYEKILAYPKEEVGRFIRFVDRNSEDSQWIQPPSALLRPKKPPWPGVNPDKSEPEDGFSGGPLGSPYGGLPAAEVRFPNLHP